MISQTPKAGQIWMYGENQYIVLSIRDEYTFLFDLSSDYGMIHENYPLWYFKNEEWKRLC